MYGETLDFQCLYIHSLKNVCTTCYSEIFKKSFGPKYTIFKLFEKTKQNKIKQKKKTFKNYFWQSIDAILEDVSVAETII